MDCSRCGAEVEEGSTYCAGCGERLSPPETPDFETAAPDPVLKRTSRSQQTRVKTWVWIALMAIIGVLVLIGLTVLLVLGLRAEAVTTQGTSPPALSAASSPAASGTGMTASFPATSGTGMASSPAVSGTTGSVVTAAAEATVLKPLADGHVDQPVQTREQCGLEEESPAADLQASVEHLP